MTAPQKTPRQQLKILLCDHPWSANDLAVHLGLPEHQIEEHLTHIVKSIRRDRARQFCIIPASCRDCGYTFRDRTRLTCPSRCPKCRSEGITPPCYRIEDRKS